MEPIIVTTPEGVVAAARAILDPDQAGPIVCLTSRAGEHEPALDPERVREIVGDGTPIYCVPTGPLTFRLTGLLPPRWDVFGGAGRLYWLPLLGSDTQRTHPLIFDRSGSYGDSALASLRRFFTAGPPIDRTSVDDEDPLLAALAEIRHLQAQVRELEAAE